MPYTPNSWVDGPAGNTPITAAQLTHIETQYSAAKTYADTTFQTLTGSPLTPYQFGAVSPVVGSDNTAALLAMFQAAAGSAYPSGASIYLPPGLWRYNGSAGLPLAANLVVRGAGRRTRLASVGTQNLFETTASLGNINFENLWLECGVAGKAIFGMGSTGGMFGSTFKKMLMVASTDTSQIWSQNGSGSFIQNTFQDVEMQRTGTSTVVPFSVITTTGNANFNQFNQVRFDGLNNVNTPFFHAESTGAATYIQDWTMINILGEQNPGGLIRVLAGFNWTVINATDEDATVDYAANLIDFQANGAGFAPQNITIIGSGRRGRQMTAGTYDISVATGGANVSIINCNPPSSSQQTLLNVPKYTNAIATRGYPGTYMGSGTPEGSVSGAVGSTFLRTDGGAGTSLYVKESGTGNTGWIGK